VPFAGGGSRAVSGGGECRGARGEAENASNVH
jgi:hypothetical protein